MHHLVAFLFFSSAWLHCSGQTVTIVNQNGRVVGSPCPVRLIAFGDTTNYQSVKGVVEWKLPQKETIVTVTINGMFVQPYYNQYTLAQLKELDTITVFESNLVGASTPVFLVLDTFQVMHPVMPELDGFKEFLMTTLNRDSLQLELAVYNTWPLSSSDRLAFEQLIKWLSLELEMPGSKLKLVFTGMPYTCSRHDFFNAGTDISKAFVSQQHTDFMENKARAYTLVGQILIAKWVWAGE